MNKKIALVAVALGILLVSGFAMAEKPQGEQGPSDVVAPDSQQKEGGGIGILSVPNPVPGNIFTGDYLRIGLNNAGTIGITNGSMTSDPGVGFQSVNDTPFKFPSTESLAIWSWGEGYNVAYKKPSGTGYIDNVAYWQPKYGYPPNATTNRIVIVSNRIIINDAQKAVRETVVRTADNNLQMTFTFTFLKQYPELDLETTITNIGAVPLRDIVYKRIAEFDVCTKTLNNWTSTAHDAYAWDTCDAVTPTYPSNKIIQLSISGHDGAFRNGRLTVDDTVLLTWPLFDVPLPVANYVDLNSWDDDRVRSPNNVVQSFAPIPSYDGAAAVYYNIGELNPKKSKTVYTVYQSNFPKITLRIVPILTAMDAPTVGDPGQ